MKNCVICNEINDTDNKSCSKCWSLNGISWSYVDYAKIYCWHCEKETKCSNSGFDGDIWTCEECKAKIIPKI